MALCYRSPAMSLLILVLHAVAMAVPVEWNPTHQPVELTISAFESVGPFEERATHEVEVGPLPPGVEPALLVGPFWDGYAIEVDGQAVATTGVLVGEGAVFDFRLYDLPPEVLKDGRLTVSTRVVAQGWFAPKMPPYLAMMVLGDRSDLETLAIANAANYQTNFMQTGFVGCCLLILGMLSALLWLTRSERAAGWFATAGLILGATALTSALVHTEAMPTPRFIGVIFQLGNWLGFAALFAFAAEVFAARHVAIRIGIPVVVGSVAVIPFVIPKVFDMNYTMVVSIVATLAMFGMAITAIRRKVPDSGVLAMGLCTLVVYVFIEELARAGLSLAMQIEPVMRWIAYLGLPGSILGVLARRYHRTLLASERFVPREFLHALGWSNVTEVVHGDRRQIQMTVLFSDVRSFTALSERIGPEATATLVDTVLGLQARLVQEHGGFVDKYIGDAVMALFPDANAALEAAEQCLRGLDTLNAERHTDEQVRIGIGLHTGEVVLAAVGTEERLNCTAMGDTVNLSSRIEGLTKQYGATAEALEGGRAVRSVDRVAVKGRNEAVDLWEAFGWLGVHPKDRRRANAAGLIAVRNALLEGRAAEAVELAQTELDPADDPVAELWISRAEQLARDGVPEGWDGVKHWETK